MSSWVRNRNYRDNPCFNCPKKGCGAYHDICPENKAWNAKKENDRKEKLKRLELSYALTELGNHRASTRKR